jgi:alkylhydroperoxidase family enzyme
MARIEYSDPAKHNDRTREILGKNRNANIFRMMAHSPSYFEQYCRLGGAIRHKGELDPIVRELAITRTGILCEAPYEIVAHKRIGKNVGVTDEQNEALENWQSATCFNEVQRAALAFTDEIVKLHKPTDATFNAIASKLTPCSAGRTATLGRLLHHDVEVSGNLCHRPAAGHGSGELTAVARTTNLTSPARNAVAPPASIPCRPRRRCRLRRCGRSARPW